LAPGKFFFLCSFHVLLTNSFLFTKLYYGEEQGKGKGHNDERERTRGRRKQPSTQRHPPLMRATARRVDGGAMMMRTPKRQDKDKDNDQRHSTPNHSREQLLAGWKQGARGWEMGDERREQRRGNNDDNDDWTTTTNAGTTRRGRTREQRELGRGPDDTNDNRRGTTTGGEGEGEGEGRQRGIPPRLHLLALQRSGSLPSTSCLSRGGGSVNYFILLVCNLNHVHLLH
jgi:hypothetical protein